MITAQSINWATHSLFLSERSLFVIVWDFRRSAEENRITYWLNLCKERAHKSPIIIVATHSDELTPKQQEAKLIEAKKLVDKWKKKRVNLKQFSVVSLNFSAASKVRSRVCFDTL